MTIKVKVKSQVVTVHTIKAKGAVEVYSTSS